MKGVLIVELLESVCLDQSIVPAILPILFVFIRLEIIIYLGVCLLWHNSKTCDERTPVNTVKPVMRGHLSIQ